MALPNNILQNVQTYNKADLAYLQNRNCFLATANKKYRDFQKANPANLGDTITFDKPPRMRAVNDLVIQFEGVQQRVQTLTVDTPVSIGIAVSAQQLIFNVEDYMDRFGRSAIEELGAVVEADVANVCIKNTYRFYGNGITPISSFQDLANALAQFRNYGASRDAVKGYLSDIAVPGIVNTGLNQFTQNRNNEMANSWEIGEFSQCEWYQSNLLPIHTAGSEGNAGTTLTVVSVTTNSEGGVITITCSGTSAAGDADSIKKYDKGEFQDNVTGFPNLRFRTFTGHIPCASPVQFQVTADAASTAGSQVTFSVNPPLQAASGINQNITSAIVAGMKIKFLPTHRAGMIQSGNQFYLAMPPLPDQDPFATSVEVDMETGASLRLTTGAVVFQNQYGTAHDAIYGYTMVDDNAIMLAFPV